MIDINSIDKNITEIVSEIKDFAATLEFRPIKEFTGFTIPYTDTWPDLPKGPGLYLFEVETSDHASFDEWLKWFQPLWEHELYKWNFVPNFKKRRVNYHFIHSQQSAKLPLYLGQSENINNRVWDHINLKMNKHTVALKLNERKNLSKTIFHLSVIEFEVENTRIILPELEAVLRGKINPLVGRQ